MAEIPIAVMFDAAKIDLTDPISTDFPPTGLEIGLGTSVLTFSLVTVNGDGIQASFPDPAITFTDPTAIPSGRFSLSPTDPTQVQLTDHDSDGGSFPFTIFVEFNNRTFQHEPVIVNEPPAPVQG